MNTSMSISDPGVLLGKAFLKIAQVFLAMLAVAFGYLAYLISEGLFSDWDLEVEEGLLTLFPSLSPEDWMIYLLIGLGVKSLIWIGILAWLERKI